MTQQFRVGFTIEQGGYMTIAASSQEEAEKKVQELLEERDLPKDAICTYRGTQIGESEVVGM
jgi:hypothetical protein